MTGTIATLPFRRMRVGLARLQQRIGWAGVCGSALVLGAGGVLADAWSVQDAFLRAESARPAVQLAIRSPQRAPAPNREGDALPPELPPASEVPLLLTQIEQAAVRNGLDWHAADYRLVAAMPLQPARLEVHCAIKGAYPQLRAMLVELHAAIPAFAIREFAASRANADTPAIEAKLSLAVFLQDGGGTDALATARNSPKFASGERGLRTTP